MTEVARDDRGEGTARGVSHAIVTAIAVWSVTAFVPRGSGLPLDEAWLHQTFARNLVEKGTLAIAPGQHDATFLSPLWDVLLALNFAGPKIDPAWWAFALNVVLHLATVNLLLALVARDAPERIGQLPWRIACLAGASAVASSADLVGFVVSGLETTLFVALVVIAIWCAARQRFLAAGLLAALAAMTRPEGLFVGVLVAASCFAQTRNVKRAVLTALPSAFVGAVLQAMVLLGKAHLASTMWTGRHWLWFETSAGLPNSDLKWELASAWVSRLGDSAGLSKHHAAFVWIALGLAAYGALRLALLRSTGTRLLVAWGVVQAWWLFRNFAPQGPGGSWQPLVPLLFALSVALGTSFVVWDLAHARGAFGPRIAVAAGVLTFGWTALAQDGLVSQLAAHRLAVADIDATSLEMGHIVAELPETALVAGFDSGAIVYRSKRSVVEIGRLAEPELAVLAERGRAWEHLREKGATHVVLAENLASRLHLDDNPAVRVKAVSTVSALSRSFTLYEMSYTGRPAPRRVYPARWAARGLWDDQRMMLRRDRRLAEHMLGILAESDVRIDLAIVPEPRPIGGGVRENTKDPAPPCAIQMGPWGVDVDECELVGPTSEVRATLGDELRPYLEVKDYGGAARALPHILTRIRRSMDDRFMPLLPPLRPPAADPRRAAPWTAPWWGVALTLTTLALALFLGIRALPPARLRALRADAAALARALVRQAR